MPNWCYNKLTITGPEADVRSFKEKAAGPCPWLKPDETEVEVLNFHSLVPVPDEVLQAGYEAAGYHWERENWGCKWGADEPQILDEGGNCIIYEFCTAWSPPIEFLQKVAVQRPALKFILEYEETGVGFKGLAKFQGEIHEDHCISL
jgi:hypothetical protein